MLCYPIISEEKDILHGVVEVINKVISEDSSESNVFTSSDKEVCSRIFPKMFKVLVQDKKQFLS